MSEKLIAIKFKFKEVLKIPLPDDKWLNLFSIS